MEPKSKNRAYLLIVSLVAVAGGVAVGHYLPEDLLGIVGPADSQMGTGEETSSGSSTTKDDGPKFVAFGHMEGDDPEAKMVGDRIIVNLNDPENVRYLNVMITLETDAANEKTVQKAVASRRPILKSWLTAYLSGKTVDEVQGTANFNRMCREIKDRFNENLFDGKELIRDVQFEDFHVQ